MAKGSKRLPKPGEFIFKIAGKREPAPGDIRYYMVHAVNGRLIQVWTVGAGNPGQWESWNS